MYDMNEIMNVGRALETIGELDLYEGVLSKAATLAVAAHFGQRRWNGEEYIRHPFRIAQRVSSLPDSLNLMAAALLHDVVEDSEVTIEHIRENFPMEIADAVDLLTHKIDETDYMAYIVKLSTNKIARLVKISDIKDNMSDLHLYPNSEKRMKKYKTALAALETVEKMSLETEDICITEAEAV